MDEKIRQAREMVLTNRQVVDEVACSVQISHGSAYQMIRDEVGFHKLCARWMPRELTTNANMLRSSQTVETINRLGFEVLDHPACSPDLAPSDYHLFGPLKNALRGFLQTKK
jgi:hypothetical protein